MINVNISITINDNEIRQAYEHAKSKLACTPEEAKHIDDEYTDKDLFYIFEQEVINKIPIPNIAEHEKFEQFHNLDHNICNALARTIIHFSANWIERLKAQYLFRYNTQNFEDSFWQEANRRSKAHGSEECYIPENPNPIFEQII